MRILTKRIKKHDKRHPEPDRPAGGLVSGSHPAENVMRLSVKPASTAGRHGMTIKINVTSSDFITAIAKIKLYREVDRTRFELKNLTGF